MSTYWATGITLNHHPLGESDRILVLFTREYGLKRVVAKGSRRPKSKLGGRTEPLICANWFLAKGKSMDLVTQCESITAYRELRADLSRLLSGLYLAELVSATIEEEAPNPELFDCLASTLLALEIAESTELVVAHFELQLLRLLGYDLELGGCVQCGAEEGEWGFSGEAGGLLCQACMRVQGGIRLHEKGVILLRRLAAVDLRTLVPHSVPESLISHGRMALKTALQLHARHPLRSSELANL